MVASSSAASVYIEKAQLINLGTRDVACRSLEAHTGGTSGFPCSGRWLIS